MEFQYNFKTHSTLLKNNWMVSNGILIWDQRLTDYNQNYDERKSTEKSMSYKTHYQAW